MFALCAVFDILLYVKDSHDWPSALAAAVPPKSGYILKPEYSRTSKVCSSASDSQLDLSIGLPQVDGQDIDSVVGNDTKSNSGAGKSDRADHNRKEDNE